MVNNNLRNLEIILKVQEGVKYEELIKEYNLPYSAISSIVDRYEEFKAYCDEMESLEAKNKRRIKICKKIIQTKLIYLL